MIAVSYLTKRKIKNIFLEVISDTKIFYIIFFNENANDQDFSKLKGDWTTSNTVLISNLMGGSQHDPSFIF